ncbi:MAG: hypothetical protein HKP61_10450 [Dactylosporangium sp.]|nr:hypothetical protein [Dactylosporangium sp.]NNJ61349.1 hypothetical protein [Dactylosporangium sp.]
MQQQHKRPIRPAMVVAAVAAFAATGVVTTACSTADDQYVYCVDEDGEVVDSDYCENDDNAGRYWYYLAKHSYRSGARMPSGWQSTRINPSDASARVKAGLPATGKIGGMKVSSGGFGKGSSGGKGSGS